MGPGIGDGFRRGPYRGPKRLKGPFKGPLGPLPAVLAAQGAQEVQGALKYGGPLGSLASLENTVVSTVNTGDRVFGAAREEGPLPFRGGRGPSEGEGPLPFGPSAAAAARGKGRFLCLGA